MHSIFRTNYTLRKEEWTFYNIIIIIYNFIIILLQAVLQDVPLPQAQLLGAGRDGDELGPDQLLPTDQLQLRGQACSVWWAVI